MLINIFHYFNDICNAPIIQIIAYEKLIDIVQILILKALDLNVGGIELHIGMTTENKIAEISFNNLKFLADFTPYFS